MSHTVQSPPLTDNVGNPVVPDPVCVEAAVPKDEPDWRHTASSAAKLLLRTVERASDVFPPLKSTAAGLCAILDNCEVWPTFVRSVRDPYTGLAANSSQQTGNQIIGVPG